MKANPMPFALAAPAQETAGRAADGGLERARRGEVAAFRALVRAHQGRVYSLALRLLGAHEEAQELAQDVFLQLHRSLERIESEAHLRFWLRRTVTHRAIDRVRRRRRESRPAAPAESETFEASGDPLLERRMRELVGELPAVPRAVVLLRYQEDLDPSDIALVLDLPLNTVKSHLRRSLAVLRGRCGPIYEESEQP